MIARSIQAPVVLFWVALCGLFCPAGRMAVAAPPDLRIDLRMHNARVLGGATDRSGRFLLTSSEDRTVRLWDLSQQSLSRTFFLPAAERLVPRAVALSADAHTLAAVGQGATHPESAAVYLWERVTGQLQRRLPAPPGVALRAHVSKDAAALTVLSSREAWSYDLATGRRLQQYAGCSGQLVDADWADDERWVLLCSDGTLRILDRQFAVLAQTRLLPGRAALHVGFAPGGQDLVLGYETPPQLEIRAAQDLRPRQTLSLADVTGGTLLGAAWTASGQALLAGVRRPDGTVLVRRWHGAQLGSIEDVSLGSWEITQIIPLRGEQRPQAPSLVLHRDFSVSSAGAQDAMAVVTAEPAIWLIQPGHPPALVRQRRSLAVQPDSLAVDLTGNRIELAVYGPTERRAQFVVSERRLRLASARDSRVEFPQRQTPGIQLNDWAKTGKLLINGRALVTGEERAWVRRVTTAPDGGSLLVATDARLSLVDRQARTKWRVEFDSAPQSLAFSRDGRVAVVALAEGSVRWLRASDGAPLLSLVCGSELTSWILWTPSGYFDSSSAHADDYVGWLVSEGPDRAPAFFHLSRMQEAMRRPDIVERILPTLDEERAVTEANAEARAVPLPLYERLPPTLQIEAADTDLEVRSQTLQLPVSLRSLSGAAVLQVRATLRDALGQSRRVIIPVSPQASAASRAVSGETSVPLAQSLVLELQVPPCDSSLLLQAETAHAVGEPVFISLHWRGPSAAVAVAPKPNLLVLAVGISTYQTKQYRLDYPAKDAADLVKLLQRQQGKLYGNVTARVVRDREATRARILEELSWLRQSATSSDVVVVFLAGHGADDPQTGIYQFFPFEADFGDISGTLLSAGKLRAALDAIEGKVVLLLDACHAGNVVQGRGSSLPSGLQRFADQVAGLGSSTIVFSAATGDQTARESVKWNNGAFTKAVVEGLLGKADPAATGFVTVAGLETYVGERVRELTAERQTPAIAKPAATVDFPLTQVTKPPYRQAWFWTALGLGALTVVGVSLAIARPWEPRPTELAF